MRQPARRALTRFTTARMFLPTALARVPQHDRSQPPARRLRNSGEKSCADGAEHDVASSDPGRHRPLTHQLAQKYG